MRLTLAHAERLLVRFLTLFVRVERQPCGHPDCRCRSHDVVVLGRFGWWATVVFVVAVWTIAASWCGYR
jgi:hypothetical protein